MQGEPRKRREAGQRLESKFTTLTGVMNNIHDALGGSLVSRMIFLLKLFLCEQLFVAAPKPSTLPIVRAFLSTARLKQQGIARQHQQRSPERPPSRNLATPNLRSPGTPTTRRCLPRTRRSHTRSRSPGREDPPDTRHGGRS